MTKANWKTIGIVISAGTVSLVAAVVLLNTRAEDSSYARLLSVLVIGVCWACWEVIISALRRGGYLLNVDVRGESPGSRFRSRIVIAGALVLALIMLFTVG